MTITERTRTMSSNKFEALGMSDDSEADDVNDSEVLLTEKREIVVPASEHRLETSYCLWFSRKSAGKQSQTFDQNLKLIGQFASCEQFWNLYSHIIRPGELQSHSDFHLFKEGIKPMWEDEANRFGGKWIVRLRKGLATRCWENLILAMLGEQFMVGKEICGAVVSIRYHTEDIVSIWNRTSNNLAVINQIRDIMKRVLNLPPNTIMEYKAHKESIRDADRRQNQMSKQNDR